MISQADSDDGRRKTKAHLMEEVDRMEIMRVKMEMGSFLHKLEPSGTILGFSFMFTHTATASAQVRHTDDFLYCWLRCCGQPRCVERQRMSAVLCGPAIRRGLGLHAAA